MQHHKLSRRSLDNLRDVHPNLIYIVRRALFTSETDFGITEGRRTEERQEELVAAGKSWTMKSKHLMQSSGFCHAVDIAAWTDEGLSWDMKHYEAIAQHFQSAADEIGVSITWGGNWTTKDGPHFQINV